jgi:hypothetical protein
LDIEGAKALKRRLGQKGLDEASPPAGDRVDIPADAPPVFHWLGVKQASPEARPATEDDGVTQATSLFRRLAPSLR